MMSTFARRPGIVYNLLNGIDFPCCDWGWGATPRPDVNIREEGDRFVLEAELPGLSKEDLNIEVDGSRLTVKASVEKSKEEGGQEEKYLLHERRALDFSRSFELARTVDVDKIEAKLEDGILRIVAPKKAEEHSKKIAIQTR